MCNTSGSESEIFSIEKETEKIMMVERESLMLSKIELEKAKYKLESLKIKSERIVFKMDNYRGAANASAGYMLHSPALERLTGINYPFQQWIFEGCVFGFLFRGIPSIVKGIRAEQYFRATNIERRRELLTKFGGDITEEGGYQATLSLKYFRLRGRVWVALPIIGALYILKMKKLQFFHNEVRDLVKAFE